MQSLGLGYKSAQTLYYAIDEQAKRIGLPINMRVTINFAQTPVDPREAPAVFAKLRNNHSNKWLKRAPDGGEPCNPTWAYVFENAKLINGEMVAFNEVHPDRPHNVHAHWMIHVPPSRQYDYKNELIGWLDYVAGGACEPNAILVQHITAEKGGQRGARMYALKGASSDFIAKRFSATHQPQGLIVGGRRSGTSRNLGPTARRALDCQRKIRRVSKSFSVASASIAS